MEILAEWTKTKNEWSKTKNEWTKTKNEWSKTQNEWTKTQNEWTNNTQVATLIGLCLHSQEGGNRLMMQSDPETFSFSKCITFFYWISPYRLTFRAIEATFCSTGAAFHCPIDRKGLGITFPGFS